MKDLVELASGSFGGALVSEALKLAIAEAKKYKSLKPLSKDLVSTMTRLLPLTQKIDSMRNQLNHSASELQELRDTIQQAQVLIHKFPGVRFYNKTKYARKIERINKAMGKFCGINLQLLQFRDQLDLSLLVGNIDDKVDGLSKRIDSLSVVPVPFFTGHLCSVPKLDKAPVGLGWALMDLKKRFIDNTSVATLVVSAPPGCGKTTLVTHLCNNVEVKGHFKHIFFNVVSSTPNFRTLVQNLLQHNGHAPQTFENDTQATVALRKLVEDGGPILLVLDDVWQGADSFLEKFRISIPRFKVLVTSRSEFRSFGSTYYLKPLEYENARPLLVRWASRPNSASPDEYKNLLKKVLVSPRLSTDHSAVPRDGISSPLPPRLSADMRPENANVHPLPLPPGAAAASSSSVPCQQPPPPPPPPLKQDSFPMNSQWKKGKLIGRGTFGSVYVASNSESGALCVMKEVELFPDDPKSAECIKQLEQEIKLLSNLQHPNIVQYFGCEIVDDRFFIYLEYVHPGSINKYIQDHCGGTMTESVVRNFTRHILSGLAYLHSKKTVHRDIKGANLLVDASGVVKLADFGMAKHLTGQRADLSLKGSPYWMAPELMQAVMQRDSNPDLAFAVDIWSLGCTIIEMFTGKPPWSEFEGAAAMFKVMRDSPPIPESMSAEGKDFLRLCFQRNPAERPTASMLQEHRFLKNSLHSTSPRNSDVSNCSQLFNGMNITEPYSRREKPIFKLDQVPRAKNVTSSESGSWQPQQQHQHRSPELIGTVTRLSSRSTSKPVSQPTTKAKH